MKIPLEFYNHLRLQIRISDVIRQRIILTRKGNEFLGVCPFHQEKTPSFTVNDAKRFYHCFGCNAHGDVIRFISETSGISYKEAAIKIAEDNGIELPKMSKTQEAQYEESDRIYNILNLAESFFTSQITAEVRKYLNDRKINDDIIKTFSIGYAPGNGKLQQFFQDKSVPLKDLLKAGLLGKKEDGKIYEIFNKRIMFPIKNLYNKVVGFGGRVIGEDLPKYINSPETLVYKKGEIMYGENIATSATYKKNYSIVVEGYLDVIAMHRAGFAETVASLGTSVTDKHLQKLWKAGEEIIICLDGDEAGARASKRTINLALSQVAHNKKISFIQLPKGLDPDDIINKGEPGLFGKLLAQRKGLSEMIWLNEYQGKKFPSAESKAELEQKLEEYCNKLKDKSLSVNFRRYFRDQVWAHLISKKRSFKESNIIHENIIVGKNYTEMEIIEHALCAFIIKFPNIIQNSEVKEFLSTIDFNQADLNDFLDWFLEQFGDIEKISSEMIEESVKKTRFYESFLVLSTPDMMFLDLSFINKNIGDQALVFEWLRKKHYLLLLKQEYASVLINSVVEAQPKASLYLEEIQKISKELNKLNEFFVN